MGWLKRGPSVKTSPDPDEIDGWKVTVKRQGRFDYRIEGRGTGRNARTLRFCYGYDQVHARFSWTAEIKAERMLARLNRKDTYRSQGYVIRS